MINRFDDGDPTTPRYVFRAKPGQTGQQVVISVHDATDTEVARILADGSYEIVGAGAGIHEQLGAAGSQLQRVQLLTQSVDLPSIAANTTTDVAVALPAGTLDANDTIIYAGAPALNAGLVVQGCHTPGTDTFMLRVSNVTAGALDAPAINFLFLVLRKV